MVDLDILKDQGVSVETLKAAFTLTKEKAKAGKGETAVLAVQEGSQRDKIDRLLRTIKSRAAGGRDYNLNNYRIYQALEEAWDLPLKQITPTMLMSLLDKTQDPVAVVDTLKTWGIDPAEVMIEVPDPKTPGLTQKVVSIPAFFRIFIPLAKAYVTIRWAKLVNDRDQVPHYKYEPAISNQITRMRCEVITAAIEEMSNQYGYFDVEKQAIHRMLHYGQQFLFPVEAWHFETQLVGKDSPYKGEAKGKYVEAVVREGIRFHQPHPARTYFDQAYYPSTFNTDSGASYAGYWRVMRYSEIVGNKNFYNLDVIKIANSDWYSSGKGFFQNVYPCTMSFPSVESASAGTGAHDSEKHIGSGFYTSILEDRGILINEYFQKLNPKEHGLGDYDHEVWFRFVIASDDTILYCEPLPYAPIVYYGYDAAENRTIQSSMTLEILPFQDHLGNLFSQYLISIKQNLYNLNLVDTDVVNAADINRMRSTAGFTFTGLNILGFSGKEFQTSQTAPKAIYSERFPQVDVNAIALAMRMILEMVERLLVMSPQEMGQVASHEQTREEVRNIQAHSSSRLEFTGGAADRAREAIKRILYEGKMAYGEDEFYAQIPADPEVDEAMLTKLGFTWKGMDTDTGRVTVTATKTAIKFEKFVANRDGADRINEAELARAMANFMNQVLANPMTSQAVGPDQAIQMINLIARSSGFPRDFKLTNQLANKSLLQQNNEELIKQVQEMVKQVVDGLTGDVKGALQRIMQDNADQSKLIEQLQALTQELQAAIQEPAAPSQPMMGQPQISQMPGGMPAEMPSMAGAFP